MKRTLYVSPDFKSEVEDQFIERRIITGLIVSTEYVDRLRNIWSSILLESSSARLLANWCIEFYDNYKRAPSKNIEGIFNNKKKSINEDYANDIAETLRDLSED